MHRDAKLASPKVEFARPARRDKGGENRFRAVIVFGRQCHGWIVAVFSGGETKESWGPDPPGGIRHNTKK